MKRILPVLKFPVLIAFSAALFVSCGTESDDGTSNGSSEPEVNVALSNDSSLSDLTVEGIELDQVFQSIQDSYTANAGYLLTSFNLTPTVNDDTATMTINGTEFTTGVEHSISLAEGANLVTIIVTAEDVTTSTYTLEVTRATVVGFAEQIMLKADDAGGSDQFGNSLAIYDDTIVVGAYYEDAVYVFTQEDSGWTQQEKLSGTNTEASDRFGESVAIYEDTIVVGSIYEDTSGGLSGAAYVFTRDNGVWTEQQMLKADDPGTNDNFGSSVAIEGNTIAVGAHQANGPSDSITYAGAAYVFTYDGAAWDQQASLTASDAEEQDKFGNSIAISDDTIVVGAQAAEVGSTNSAGVAYVFLRTDTAWNEEDILEASNPGGSDYFAINVDIEEDDTIVVGSRDADVDGNVAIGTGAVYIFSRTGTTWTEDATFTGSNTQDNYEFGYSVALDGNHLIVGACDDDQTLDGAGSVYLFSYDGSTWTEQGNYESSNPSANDDFGCTVAISGDTVVVGAPYEDSDATGAGIANSSGAAYVFQ